MTDSIELNHISKNCNLTNLTSENMSVDNEMLLPFSDSVRLITELLSSSIVESNRLVSIGPVTNDLLNSISKTELSHHEIIGIHPFSLDAAQIISDIEKTDTVYLANPNKLNGASYSIGEMQLIASAVSGGYLIVDEYYYDFFGVSALSLLEDYSNIIIIRSYTAVNGDNSSNAGYVISSSEIIESLHREEFGNDISELHEKLIYSILKNKDICLRKFYEIHSETLKAAIDLNRLGAQCRITPADYILIQVSNPEKVAEYLRQSKVNFELNDRYSSLGNQIKYRFETSFEYSRLINAFNSMPSDYYRMIPMDNRNLTLKRRGEYRAAAVENRLNDEFETSPHLLVTD